MKFFIGYVSYKEWYYIKDFKIRISEKLFKLQEVIYGTLLEEFIYDDSEQSEQENEIYSYMSDVELKKFEAKEYHITIFISNEPQPDCRRIVIWGEIDPKDFYWENKEGIITLREHNKVVELVNA